MNDSLLQDLESHPFVSDFSPQDRARLATLAKEVRFEPDQVIFREGDDYSVFYLLGKGMGSPPENDRYGTSRSSSWSRTAKTWSRSSSSANALPGPLSSMQCRQARLHSFVICQAT